ncbi:helix-turn-helix domain-containing protein [Streptomyces sp. NPDC058632]|uniref:helix-turn-helix domain-containing protein n=1 Tax=Streptomyces sp. NPDC058632 TaxID=3346567 RepID=UPI00364E6BB1
MGADSDSAAVLRDTVRCYLDSERSVSMVARTMHIAKNTVLHRVRKAEKLRGRPLSEDRLRLHAALHLAKTLSPM